MSKLEQGQKAYEAHVASQPVPRRYKPWSKLPETTRADFAIAEEAAGSSARLALEKVAKKKAAKKAASKKAAAKKAASKKAAAKK